MSDSQTLRAFINYAAAYAPAEKYDLILWDHGDGPVGGYGIDSHDDELDADGYARAMSFPGIVDAISGNAVTDADGDGTPDGKFDFVDFDACLMGSTEVMLALSGYADYYIASPMIEPWKGQDYRGWLNAVG